MADFAASAMPATIARLMIGFMIAPLPGRVARSASVDRDVELFHQPREFVEVVTEEAGELLDAATDRLQRRLLEIVAHGTIGERLVDLRIEAGGGGPRRPRRRGQPPPPPGPQPPPSPLLRGRARPPA